MENKPSYEELVKKLADLEEILEALRNHEVDAVIGTKSVLILRLKEAENQLKKQRDYLERTVEERTREIRELSCRLIDTQEKERATIGHELHDEIGQDLTYAALLIDRASSKSDEVALAEAGKVVRDSIAKVRDLSTMLAPPLLKNIGLSESLKYLIQQHIKATQMKVDVDLTNGLEIIPESKLLGIYRIVQEALTNAARHAKASKVKVCLSCQDGSVRLLIIDNGIGFDVGSTVKSTGLIGMKERMLSLEGELTIESSSGHGTRIVGIIPLSKR